jgi:hypothetical protein
MARRYPDTQLIDVVNEPLPHPQLNRKGRPTMPIPRAGADVTRADRDKGLLRTPYPTSAE